MKKRLLSAFLALSMLFSMFPTVLANQTIDENGSLSTTDNTNLLKDFNISIKNGVLESIKFTLGDTATNSEGKVFIAAVTDYNWDPSDENSNDILTFESTETGAEGYNYLMWNDVASPSIDDFAAPFAQWTIDGVKQDSVVEATLDNANQKNYNWGDDSSWDDVGIEKPTEIKIKVYIASSQQNIVNSTVGFVHSFTLDENGNYKFPEETGDTDITAITASIEKPAYGGTPATQATGISATPGGVSATTANLTWTDNPTSFAYDTEYTTTFELTPNIGYKFTDSTTVNIDGTTSTSISVDSSTGVATVTAKFKTAAQQIQSVVSVEANITAPAVKTEPASSVNNLANANPANSVTLDTPAITWEGDKLENGNFKAGQVYTAKFTLTAADGYKFDDNSTVTVNGAQSVTVTPTADDSGKTALVTVTYKAIERTVESITATATSVGSYQPGNQFALPTDLNVTLTYNDGTTAGFSADQVSSGNNFSFVYGNGVNKTAIAVGESLTINHDNQAVFVKYTGNDITDGKSELISESIGALSVKYAPIDSAAVTVATPKPGGTPATTATVPDGVNYSVDTDGVTWFEVTDSGDVATTNFEYGKKYKVQVTVGANTNYTFATTATATINGDSATPNFGESGSEDYEVMTLTKTFDAIPVPTISSTTSYDAYNGGNDITITLNSTDANPTKVVLSSSDGKQLELVSSNGGFTVSRGVITINKSKITGDIVSGLGSSDSTWNVKVTIDNYSGTIDSTLTAKDTTPYITVTQPAEGIKITLNGSEVTYGQKTAIKKTENVLKATTATEHAKSFTWSDITGGTASKDSVDNDTYTFTPGDGADLTASVTLTKYDSYTVTVNHGDNGEVQQNGTKVESAITAWTDDSDNIVLTVAPSEGYKFNGLSSAPAGVTVSGNAITITPSSLTSDITITPTYAEKTDPSISPASAQKTKGESGNVTYTITPNDYTYQSMSITKDGSAYTNSGSAFSVSGNTLTVSNAGSLEAGVYTITLTFDESKTVTATLTIKSKIEMKSVSLPENLEHGDAITTFSFVVDKDGTKTTYTYSNGSWDTTPPDNTNVKVNNGTAMSINDFISTYIGSDKHVRRTAKDSDNCLVNGYPVQISVGESSKSATLAVGTKKLVPTLSNNTDLDKTYNGNSTVDTDDLNGVSVTSWENLLDGDTVTAAATAGTYYEAGGFTTEAKNAILTVNGYAIKLTLTLSGADAANYTVDTASGSGRIDKRAITIASITNIPAATLGKTDTYTASNKAAAVPANTTYAIGSTEVVSGESVDFTYTYNYNDGTNSPSETGSYNNVKVTNIALAADETNYILNPTELTGQTGTVNEREIESITVTGPTKTSYYYSDTFDPSGLKVTVKYKNETDTVDYAWNANDLPQSITFKWTDTENEVSGSEALNVPDYNGKTITVSDGGTGESHNKTTGAITVKPIPVKVTATGSISKTYDGNKTFNSDNTDHTGSVSLAYALDSSLTDDNGRYAGKISDELGTGKTLGDATVTVAFGSENYTETAQTAAVEINTPDGWKNFTVQTSENQATSKINKRHVTVTAITVPTIKQYSADKQVPVNPANNSDITYGATSATVSGAVDAYKPEVQYKYTYNDPKTAGDTIDITIEDLQLTSNGANNINYTLETGSPTASGSVTARTIGNFTVTAPTQFTDSTTDTYGDKLNLGGLIVSITYGEGDDARTEQYVWKEEISGTTTWTKKVEGESDTEVDTVPFTWSWGNADGEKPVNGEILTVVDHSGKGIYAQSTDDMTKNNTSGSVTVNKFEINAIDVTVDGSITKVYDKTKAIDNGSATTNKDKLSYNIGSSVTLPVENDALSVSPETVLFAGENANENVNIEFSGWQLAAADAAGSDHTTNINNYKLADSPTVTSVTGKITQRLLAVTAVSDIPHISQYDTIEQKTISSDTGATFAAVDGNTESGLVEGDTKPAITYKYKYSKNTPPGEDDAVSVTDIAFVDKVNNYKLNNNTLTAKGTIDATGISALTIMGVPAQFDNANVQYGDKLNLEGLEVKAEYGSPVLRTEYYKLVSDGSNGVKWQIKVGDDGSYEDFNGNPPFALKLGDSNMPDHGSTLETVDTDDGKTVKAVIPGTEGSADITGESTQKLKVNKRKVTVTPSGTVTKVYDGNTTYTGNITYTVGLPESVTGYTLPEGANAVTASATATFDSANASENNGATKVSFTNVKLSDEDNFVIEGAVNDLSAAITKRMIKLTAITNVENADQYSTPAKVENQTATSAAGGGATFAATAGEGYNVIVNSETVTVKYSYQYNDTKEQKDNNVDLSDIRIDTDTVSSNYSLFSDLPTAATGTLNMASVTITVTNPTQFNNTPRYGDKLNIDGLQVKISTTIGTNPAEDVTYTASVSGETVTWSDSTNNVNEVDLPFTLSWAQNQGGEVFANGTAFANVGTYQIKAEHKTKDANDIPIATGNGSAVTVGKRQITEVKAALKNGLTITKTYDGGTAIGSDGDNSSNADKIDYSSEQVLEGDSVSLSATATYSSKNAADGITINFADPTLATNDKYELAGDAAVSGTVTGTITAKNVTINKVYIPSTYFDAANSGGVKISKTDQYVSVSASDAADGVALANPGFVSGEEGKYKLSYDVVYSEETVKNESNKNQQVSVTVNNTVVEETDATSYPKSNYNITWNLGDTKGYLSDDQITAVKIEENGAKLTEYKHGDILNLANLKVTVTSANYPAGQEYVLTLDNDTYTYKWQVSGGTTGLPAGVTVKIGSGSTATDLTNGISDTAKAHHNNMNSQKITVSAEGVEADNDDSTSEMSVTTSELTVTPTATSWDKTYDADADVKNVTFVLSGFKFDDESNKVSVVETAKAEYSKDDAADANVLLSDGAAAAKPIKFTDATNLTSTDNLTHNNYTAKIADGTYEGTINRFALPITAINDTLTAKWKDTSTQEDDVESTTSYTTSATNIPDGSLAIKYHYSFDSIDTVKNEQDVTISNVALADAHSAIKDNYNVTWTGSKTGAVELKGIEKIEITKTNTQYKYGDTLSLEDLTVKVTYESNGGVVDSIKYNDNSWNALGLKLDISNNIVAGETVLKNSEHNNATIKVNNGKTDSDKVESNSIGLTVRKLKLNITAASDTITKTYDGDKTVDQTVTLTVNATGGEVSGVNYDAPVSGDNIGINSEKYTYSYESKNAAAGIAVKPAEEEGFLTGSNTGEYEYTLPELTGAITAKEVTLTPNVTETIYSNPFATTDKDVLSTTTGNTVTASGFVNTSASGGVNEADKYTLTYTLKLTADNLKTAGNVSIPVQVSGSDNSNYEKSVTETDSTNYPASNYTFSWQDATVTITENTPFEIEITQAPTEMEYIYGKKVDLTGLKVKVKYAQDSLEKEYTYGTDWPESGFTITLSDGSAIDKVLKTGNSGDTGKGITVTYKNLDPKTTTETLTVNKRKIALKAEADSDGISQTYSNSVDADKSQFTVSVDDSASDVDGVLNGDSVTVVTTGMSAVYDDKNKGENKAITISGVTITATNGSSEDVADQYEFEQPTGLQGKITPLEIIVTPGAIPEMLQGTMGDDLTVAVPVSGYNPSIYNDGDNVSVTLKAAYPNADDLNDSVDLTNAITITQVNNNNENYTFKLAEGPFYGKVVDNKINTLTINTAPNMTYTHGDTFSFKTESAGMKVTAEYLKELTMGGSDKTVIFEYQTSGENEGKWVSDQAVDSKTVFTTAELPFKIYLSNSNNTDSLNIYKEIKDTTQLVYTRDNKKYVAVTGGDGKAVVDGALTVNQAIISGVTVAYGSNEDTPYTALDISKTYNGTTALKEGDLAKLKFELSDSEIKTIDGTTDTVTISTENVTYTDKNASADAQDLVFSNTTSDWTLSGDGSDDDSGNYKIEATGFNISKTGNIQGYITPATLTVKITSVPPIIIGADKNVSLTKGKHYTQSGEVTADETTETVNVTVKGEYEQNTTATSAGGSGKVTYTGVIEDKNNADNENADTNYTVKLVDGNGNVIDGVSYAGPGGTVNKQPVKGVTVTGPTDPTYEHGDKLDLDGLTITVTYADDDEDDTNDKKKVYVYSGEDNKWHEDTKTGTELTGAPEDLTITWGDTSTAVEDEALLRLDDTDKGLDPDGDTGNKNTAITVKSTVPNKDGTTYPSGTTDITVTKRKLTLAISGGLEKVYDSKTNITAATTGKLTFTLNGVQDGDSGVAVDETATQANIKFPDANVAHYVNAAGTAAEAKLLVIGALVMSTNDGGKLAYYKLPAVDTENSANSTLTSTATGKITKKPFTITAITGPTVETGADASKTITVGKDKYTTDPANALIGDDDVKITLTYTFTNGTGNADNAAELTYKDVKVAADTDASGNAAVANNYDITITATDGTGKVTGGEVTGIAIKAPDQKKYTHGDSINLAGTEITLTYDNNNDKTDKYTYDSETKKWTLTKNGVVQAEKVELPPELTLSFTGKGAVTPDTVVKYANNDDTLTATYKKDAEAAPVTAATNDADKLEVSQKQITITAANKANMPIEQEYSKSKTLSDENFARLEITLPADFAVNGETVSIKPADKVTAEFDSANVAKNEDGTVKAQDIKLTNGAYTLDGKDRDSYKLVIENSAVGTVTPKEITVTANSVPAINEGETNPVVDITDYTVTGKLDGDNLTIKWQGTYDKATAKVDTTTTREVTGDASVNYKWTFTPDEMQGEVKLKTVTEIVIDHQPKFSTTDPEHGDKIGEDGLDDLEYTVKYSDGTETKHKKENGEWKTDGGYTAPDPDTTFKWNGTTEDVTPDSVIRKDKPNTVTIAKEGKSVVTSAVTAKAKPVTITAAGTYKKVYDGTSDITISASAPEITYTITGLVNGDAVTVTAKPAFADENVAKFNNDYVKAIVFTDVKLTGDENILANYEIAKDENGKEIADITGAITPKTIKITSLPVPAKSKGASSLDFTQTGVGDDEFTTADIIDKDKGTVKIGYKGTYSSTAAAGKDIPVTITEINIEADDKAMLNYVVTPADVTGAVGEVTSGGGGGGGGGGGNSLTIRYEPKEGEKTGEAVPSQVTISMDESPLKLEAAFSSKVSNPKVNWTTSDEKIATVDENGLITFISEGKVEITATSEANNSLKDKVEFTVTPSTATPAPTVEPTPTPVPKEDSKITKDMMNPYIIGYDDNMFGPELPISREEVATIFARLIANSIYMDTTYNSQFWDVTGDDWSRDYIGYLETFDILHGYDDGSFMPKAYITRAEMAVMMARAEGYDIEGFMAAEETGYPDIPEDYGSWATIAIKYLTQAGVMEGYEDGTFRPTQPITRAETVATVNRVLADMYADPIEVLPSDMTDAHWAYNEVVFAMNHRVLKDVAADPNKFVWSDEFDKNMKKVEVTVPQDNGEESSPSGLEEDKESAPDAVKEPEPTVAPTEEPKTTE